MINFRREIDHLITQHRASAAVKRDTVKEYLRLVLLYLFWSIPHAQATDSLIFSGIEGSVNSDISMQVLTEAYAQLSINIEYLPLPGARALHKSNSGEVDGEVFRIANVEKKFTNLRPVPTAINRLEGIVFTKSLDFKIQGWSSLSPYYIGIQNGIRFADRGTEDMQRLAVDTNEQLFLMLNEGRVELAVAAYTNGLKTMSKLNLNTIRALEPAIETYPLYHYLHINHADLIPKLDQVLVNMANNGRIRAIREAALLALKN